MIRLTADAGQLRIDSVGRAILAVALPGDDEPIRVEHVYGRPTLFSGRLLVDSELAADGHSVSAISLTEHPMGTSVLIVAVPGDDETPPTRHGYHRRGLIVDGAGVDAKLISESGAGGGEALSKDTVSIPILAIPIAIAFPDRHEVAGVIDSHTGVRLVAVAIAVDHELVVGCRAIGQKLPSIYRGSIVPTDDELPAVVHGHGRPVLVRSGVGTDPEFRPVRRPVLQISLGVDPTVVADVLAGAPPDDDEVAVRVDGHRGGVLVGIRVRIDREFVPRGRAVGGVLPGVRPPPGAVLPVALPGHHKPTVIRHGNRGELLVPVRGRVDLQLAADRRAGGVESLPVDAKAAAVLVAALPNGDVVPRGVEPHGGIGLLVRGCCVGLLLRTQQGQGRHVHGRLVEGGLVGVVGLVSLGHGISRIDDQPHVPVTGCHVRNRKGLSVGMGGVRLQAINRKQTTQRRVARIYHVVRREVVPSGKRPRAGSPLVTNRALNLDGLLEIDSAGGLHSDRCQVRLRQPFAVQLGIDPVVTAVLSITLPGNEKVIAGSDRQGWIRLGAVGVGVGAEFSARRRSIRPVTLGIDAVTGTILIAIPSDHEFTARIHHHGWISLRTADVGVHPELLSERRTIGRVALAVDAVA